MGERTVEVRKEVTESVSVDICDKCGLEADELTALYPHRDVKAVVNSTEDAMPYSLGRVSWGTDRRKGMVRARTIDIPPDAALLIEERASEPLAEICGDCYEEVFGWSESA